MTVYLGSLKDVKRNMYEHKLEGFISYELHKDFIELVTEEGNMFVSKKNFVTIRIKKEINESDLLNTKTVKVVSESESYKMRSDSFNGIVYINSCYNYQLIEDILIIQCKNSDYIINTKNIDYFSIKK